MGSCPPTFFAPYDPHPQKETVLDIIDGHGSQAMKYAAPGLGPYSPRCLAECLLELGW